MGSAGAWAQFATPTIDGTINPGEYGTHTDGQNQQDNTSNVIWYMTWDNTNLYVGISGGVRTEAAVLYLTTSPQTPINGGTDANGSLVGREFDNTNFASLPFRANFACYFKNGYHEYRISDGSGGWSAQTANTLTYADATGSPDRREIAIPWSVMPSGARPASFLWTGYQTSALGFVYGEMPLENPSGSLGTSARFSRYYSVATTSNGSSTKPFSRNCYVFNRTSDDSTFGTVAVWDFTMNNSSLSITRTAASNWTIGGTLRVDAGTVNFASGGTGSTDIGAVVLAGGTLNFASQSEDVTVSGNVTINSGAELKLSTASGSDLFLGGNWTRNGTGILTPNGRAVRFTGAGRTLTGQTTFDYFFVENGASLTLNSQVFIEKSLTLESGGTLAINGQTIEIRNDANLTSNKASATDLSSGLVVWKGTTAADYNAYVTGPFIFGNVEIQSFGVPNIEYVHFGSNTLNGTMTIKTGGGTLNSPTYGPSSKIKYQTGFPYIVSHEWDLGVTPNEVQVSGGTNLQFAPATGITPGDRILNGKLTIDAGATFTAPGPGYGTFRPKGDLQNDGTFSANGGTVSFEGATTQNLIANAAVAFNNLTVASGTTLIESVSADNATVAGTLTNNGTIRKEKTVSGAGTLTFGLTKLAMNVVTPAALTSLTIDRVDSNHPNATSRQMTGKYWLITSNASPGAFSVDLTLPHSVAQATAMLCRYNGASWDEGRSSATANDVTLNGVSAFSPWAVGTIPAEVEDWNLHQ